MPERPTIALVSSNYAPHVEGGAELITQFLAECIQRSGRHRAIVISLNPQTTEAVDEVNGVTVYRVGRRNVYSPVQHTRAQRGRVQKLAYHVLDSWNALASRQLRPILERERPAVVNTHNIGGLSTDVWRQTALAGIPLVHTLHDSYLLCYRTTRFRDRYCEQRCSACRMGTGIRRQQSARVDAVIGVSRFILDAHLDQGYFPRARTAVVLNGRPLIDAKAGGASSHAESGSGAEPPDAARCGDSQRPWTVGFVGRIEFVKGVEVLLQAFLQAAIPGARLLLAGRGEATYVQGLKARFASPDIHFLGHVPMEGFYPQVDLMVLPTLTPEGAGSGYEPWEYGIPVLTSRAGGLPEVAVHDPEGALFEPGDVQALVQLLQSARVRWPEPDRMRALKAIRRLFVPERQLEQTLQVYRDVGAAV